MHGRKAARIKGTPQGGVIGPLLLNLFMHYAFDKWMDRIYPDCPFARYADDGVPRALIVASAAGGAQLLHMR